MKIIFKKLITEKEITDSESSEFSKTMSFLSFLEEEIDSSIDDFEKYEADGYSETVNKSISKFLDQCVIVKKMINIAKNKFSDYDAKFGKIFSTDKYVDNSDFQRGNFTCSLRELEKIIKEIEQFPTEKLATEVLDVAIGLFEELEYADKLFNELIEVLDDEEVD